MMSSSRHIAEAVRALRLRDFHKGVETGDENRSSRLFKYGDNDPRYVNGIIYGRRHADGRCPCTAVAIVVLPIARRRSVSLLLHAHGTPAQTFFLVLDACTKAEAPTGNLQLRLVSTQEVEPPSDSSKTRSPENAADYVLSCYQTVSSSRGQRFDRFLWCPLAGSISSVSMRQKCTRPFIIHLSQFARQVFCTHRSPSRTIRSHAYCMPLRLPS